MSNIVTYEARFNTDDFTRGAQNIFTQVNQMNQVFNQTNTFIGSLGNKFKDSVLLFKKATEVEFSSSGGKRTVSLGRRLT